MSLFRKAAAILATPRTQPPLAVAQRLNYDVLSCIFSLSSSEWQEAALTLCSVCRLWKITALSMPQLWSRIYFGTFIPPEYLGTILARSQSLPLHIRLHATVNNKHLEVLKSVKDRVFSMKVDEKQKHQLVKQGCHQGSHDMWQPLSQAPAYRLLQRVNIVQAHETEIQPSSTKTYTLGFPALKKLDISGDVAHWSSIIRNVERTLVSLHIRITGRPEDCSSPLIFEQLRHLRITQYDDSIAPVLNIVVRGLVSFDERYNSRTARQILLWGSLSVTHLHTGNFPLELPSYPALRVLWIRDMAQHAQESVIPLLQTQILCTPELKEVWYYDHMHYIQSKKGVADRVLSPLFSKIFNLIQATGRDIVVREFIPSDLNLPGSSGF